MKTGEEREERRVKREDRREKRYARREKMEEGGGGIYEMREKMQYISERR